MNSSKLINILTVLLLGIAGVGGVFGIRAQAGVIASEVTPAENSETAGTEAESAGTKGTEAESAGTKSTEAESAQRNYTPYELGCMAQYYYKRMDANGQYPSKVKSEKNQDGTYVITLFESKTYEDNTVVDTTYAIYRLGTDAKGTDEISGKEIDLTLYSKVYTPEKLCKLAQNYFYTVNDFYPPEATYSANKDGTYTICLFETINDAEGIEHSATCGWYTVNVCGLGTDDLMMQAIDING